MNKNTTAHLNTDTANFQFSIRGRLPKRFTPELADALFYAWVSGKVHLPKGVEVRIKIWRDGSVRKYEYSSLQKSREELLVILGIGLRAQKRKDLIFAKKESR